MRMVVYPILLEPRLFSRVWGGRALPPVFAPDKVLDLPLGEVWAVHGELTCRNGAYAGCCLDDIWRRFPQAMSGTERVPAEFPLMIKWLDTDDWLSIQVHPDDAQARVLEDDAQASGKVECWYVMAARHQGELICGCRHEDDVQKLAELEGRELLPHLHRQCVQRGDFLFVPPGTIHALGPGITVLEVQQRSTITYRFYDWDRQPQAGVERPLHLRQARQAWLRSSRLALHGGRQPRSVLGELLTANAFFAQELIVVNKELSWDYQGLEMIVALDAPCRVTLGGIAVELEPMGTAILPAAGERVALSTAGEARIMRVMCPQ